MAVQDDRREEFLRQLLNLIKPIGSGRMGVDAELRLDDGRVAPFELKSTTGKSVSTVRDFGPDHIKKWRGKHWAVGFFDKTGNILNRCVYASPAHMEPWIREKEEYIRLDFELAQLAGRVDRELYEELLIRNFGDRDAYTLEQAKRIQKKQYTEQEYADRMDRPGGFSKDRMVEILADRWTYLTERGSTLNNPHIPASYFNPCPVLRLAAALRLVLPLNPSTNRAARRARLDLVAEVLRVLGPAPPAASE